MRTLLVWLDYAVAVRLFIRTAAVFADTKLRCENLRVIGELARLFNAG
jgi:hypothetical protein